LPGLDFVALAAGQGMQALRVEQAAQLRPVLQQALRSAVPILVEVEVA